MAVLAAVLLFRNIFSSFGMQNQVYTVPDLRGYTLEDARELAEVKGIFDVQQSGTAPSDRTAGLIIDQNPSPESQIKSNLVIYVTVSSGEDRGEMPNLVEQEARDAEYVQLKELKEKYSLTIITEEEASDTINQGYITRTEPAAGEPLKKGDTVTLWVSTGPAETKVGLFIGQDINKVIPYLESSWKLKLGETSSRESDQAAGTIIEQSLKENEMVPVNSEISFVISSGPASSVDEVEVEIAPDLPTDRDTVQLRVELNGEVVFDEEVACSMGAYPMTIRGTGTGEISYYWDGVLQNTFEVPFT